MEHTLFAASNGGRDVARCAALVNRKYQKAKHERAGFIGYFAAAPGEELAVRTLFERSETWLRDRGVGADGVTRFCRQRVGYRQ